MASIGYDADDNATALAPPSMLKKDYATSLTKGSLKGLRLGLIEGFFNRTETNETTPVNDAMAETVSRLRDAGAKVISITDSLYNATAISDELDTQRYEFREQANAYLQRPSLKGQHPRTLHELYSSGKFLVIPSEYEYVTTSLVSSTSNQTSEGYTGYADVLQGIQMLTLSLRRTFAENNLDALLYPEQKNLVVKIGSPSQSGRNGILAALTGSPVVTVPVGFSPPSETAPKGIPIGMEILGMPWTEEKLLQIAFQIEQVRRVRKIPRWAEETVFTKTLAAVPKIVPNRNNIPSEYPLGVLHN